MTDKEEREAIMRWLREQGEELNKSAGHYGERGIWHLAADYDRQAKLFFEIKNAIERGEHHKG